MKVTQEAVDMVAAYGSFKYYREYQLQLFICKDYMPTGCCNCKRFCLTVDGELFYRHPPRTKLRVKIRNNGRFRVSNKDEILHNIEKLFSPYKVFFDHDYYDAFKNKSSCTFVWVERRVLCDAIRLVNHRNQFSELRLKINPARIQKGRTEAVSGLPVFPVPPPKDPYLMDDNSKRSLAMTRSSYWTKGGLFKSPKLIISKLSHVWFSSADSLTNPLTTKGVIILPACGCEVDTDAAAELWREFVENCRQFMEEDQAFAENKAESPWMKKHCQFSTSKKDIKALYLIRLMIHDEENCEWLMRYLKLLWQKCQCGQVEK